jgi:hypothetical protein
VPYFIYRMFPLRRLEQVTRTPSFGEASVQAKALRASPERPADCAIKVIFAATAEEAEQLLLQAREKQPGLADDE